jgi:hypothetical protein
MEEEMDLGLAPEVDEVSEEAKGADS